MADLGKCTELPTEIGLAVLLDRDDCPTEGQNGTGWQRDLDFDFHFDPETCPQCGIERFFGPRGEEIFSITNPAPVLETLTGIPAENLGAAVAAPDVGAVIAVPDVAAPVASPTEAITPTAPAAIINQAAIARVAHTMRRY